MRQAPGTHSCFRLEIRFALTLPSNVEPFDLWHALSYQVMRQPGDLLAHTRRILLCRHPQLQGCLSGALYDLCVITGSRGGALKQRLLRLCRAELGIEQSRLFEQVLADPALVMDLHGDPVSATSPGSAGESSAGSAQEPGARSEHGWITSPAGSVLPTMTQLLEKAAVTRRRLSGSSAAAPP